MLSVNKLVRLEQAKTNNNAQQREMVQHYACFFSELGTFACTLITMGS